jgi:hypothetical protein
MNTTSTKKNRTGLVVGAIALAVACSGGAYAAGAAITSSAQIKSGVVNTGDIKNGTVKVKDLNKKTVAKLTAPQQLEAWKDMTLPAPWTGVPGYFTPAFRADTVNDVVHLRGTMSFNSDNGSNKTVFTLPAGYRPAQAVALNVTSLTPLVGDLSPEGAIFIETDGDVIVDGETDDRFISLDGLSFTLS